MKRPLFFTSLLSTLLLWSAPLAFAQDGSITLMGRHSSNKPRVTLDKPEKELYRGMIPGTRDTVKHIRRDASKIKRKNGLTWIGFLAKENTTRIFVQMTDTPDYTTSRNRSGSEITLTFNNTKLVDRNFMRHIDTRFHKRDVKYIRTKKRGKNITITITVKAGSEPQFDTQGNYLNIDFTHVPEPDKESTKKPEPTSRNAHSDEDKNEDENTDQASDNSDDDEAF